jgi:hypothetical protein
MKETNTPDTPCSGCLQVAKAQSRSLQFSASSVIAARQAVRSWDSTSRNRSGRAPVDHFCVAKTMCRQGLDNFARGSIYAGTLGGGERL